MFDALGDFEGVRVPLSVSFRIQENVAQI